MWTNVTFFNTSGTLRIQGTTFPARKGLNVKKDWKLISSVARYPLRTVDDFLCISNYQLTHQMWGGLESGGSIGEDEALYGWEYIRSKHM